MLRLNGGHPSTGPSRSALVASHSHLGHVDFKKSNLDIKNVVEVISQGAAGSWQMENRHKTMSENKYDFGFAVDWMRKDLNICLDEANRNGSALPITALIDQFYKDVQNNGGGRLDTSSLLKRLESL